jgi:hypothetical protein
MNFKTQLVFYIYYSFTDIHHTESAVNLLDVPLSTTHLVLCYSVLLYLTLLAACYAMKTLESSPLVTLESL